MFFRAKNRPSAEVVECSGGRAGLPAPEQFLGVDMIMLRSGSVFTPLAVAHERQAVHVQGRIVLGEDGTSPSAQV